MNAFLANHALPPEFLLAGDRPEPWKPADSLVIGKLEAYQLSQNFKLKLLRARLAAKLGEERANWLFPGARPGDPITTLPAISDTHASDDRIDDELIAGSVVNGSPGRSKAGLPFFSELGGKLGRAGA